MIVWFSGTGNSRYVARRLGKLLGEDLLRIDAAYPDAVGLLSSQQRIIWVCPVYGWRVPPVVERAVAQMPEAVGGSAEHWLVVTCGDDVGETPRFWRETLATRGWRSAAVYSVQMPNTYVFLPGFDVDKPATVAKKLAAAPGCIESISRAIAGGEADVDWVRPGAFPALKSRVLGDLFRKRLMSPADFRVDADRCVGCANCVTACPMDNITLDASRHPVWGSDCAFCTACYQVCSHQAISHGRWSRGKGRQILGRD